MLDRDGLEAPEEAAGDAALAVERGDEEFLDVALVWDCLGEGGGQGDDADYLWWVTVVRTTGYDGV